MLGRIIEPTSALDTVRALDELGTGSPSRVTFMRCLKRAVMMDNRSLIASKERRVDPQVTLGLLTDGGGFPLAVHLFEGNKAETKTLIPILTEFAEDHQEAADIVVIADAGMLSAANLLALEEAGFRFIVGSKISKAPYDLTAHSSGRAARPRRVVSQWRFARATGTTTRRSTP